MRNALKRMLATTIRALFVPPLSCISFERGEMIEGASVHTLVHAGNWRLGLIAMSSFMLQTGKRWQVFIHEDGSLSERDRSIIQRVHSGWKLVRRKEADGKAQSALRQYTCLLERRNENNLMLKFVDPYLYAPFCRYLFLDPDVFFFSPPVELVAWAQDGGREGCWFMREYEGVYAYSFMPEQLCALSGGEVKAGVNTGICLLNKSLLSFEQAESFLMQIRDVKMKGEKAWYLEQTLFAVVATRSPGGLLPATYITGYDARRRRHGNACIACHYVGPTKQFRLYIDGIMGVAGSFIRQAVMPYGQPEVRSASHGIRS